MWPFQSGQLEWRAWRRPFWNKTPRLWNAKGQVYLGYKITHNHASDVSVLSKAARREWDLKSRVPIPEWGQGIYHFIGVRFIPVTTGNRTLSRFGGRVVNNLSASTMATIPCSSPTAAARVARTAAISFFLLFFLSLIKSKTLPDRMGEWIP